MRMKKKTSAGVILVYVIIGLITLLYITMKFSESQSKPYSFKDTGLMGNALFYDTLEEL